MVIDLEKNNTTEQKIFFVTPSTRTTRRSCTEQGKAQILTQKYATGARKVDESVQCLPHMRTLA